jgi:glutathione S-transferase
VDLQDKPRDFVELYAKANPLVGARAKVPLLSVNDGEAVLCESLVVAEYVAERFGGVLLPRSAEDRALMRLFTELCGPIFSYFPLLRSNGDQLKSPLDTFKEGLVNVDNFLKSLGRKDGGPFLFGEQFTLAECNAAPFLQRCCTVLPAFTGGDDNNDNNNNGKPVCPLEICDELGLVRLKGWIEAVLARPSVVATGVPKEDMLKSTTRMLERFAAMDSNE